MNFRVTTVVFLISLATCSMSAQEQFRGERAYSYIETLCKPEFAGRKTGLPGARKAAEWIGQEFKQWGLKPAGDRGSFIQEYALLVTQEVSTAKYVLENGNFGPVTYQEGNDFTVYFNSGSGKISSEVVFAGDGISEPEKGRDDYAGIDVKGKIVLIYRGVPEDGKDWSKENERDYKMNVATRHGAAALLILEQREFAIRGGTIHEEGYNAQMPAVAVSRKMVRDIFQGLYRNLGDVIRDLAKGPQSFATGRRVSLSVDVQRIEPGRGENVVGLLPGTDPKLKDEFIVIGGHMDHNGMSPDGHYYVGADDDASGTSVVMELARAFASRKSGLKRSVLFIGFGGEEQGLRGSKYFAAHPTVPQEKICAMFNFDMEGCGDGGGGFGGRNLFPAGVQDYVTFLPDSVRKKLQVSRAWGMGGSDHSYFIDKGIPALGFFSSGDHPFYHEEEDVPKTINVQSLQFVGDCAAGLLEKLANERASLLYEGVRTGRCFLMFGDQIDFEPEAGFTSVLEKDAGNAVRLTERMGIHGLVLPVTGAGSILPDAKDLCSAADSASQWVKGDAEHFLRFKNGNSLSDGAGAGKLALAFRIDGTGPLGGNVSSLRNIARLGLNFFHFGTVDDPAFAGGKLTQFGSQVFRTLKDEHVIVDWAVGDIAIAESVLKEFDGKVIVRLKPELLRDLLRRVPELATSRNVLLVAECCQETAAADLSELVDAAGEHGLHISVASHFCRGTNRPDWTYRLLQELYGLRLEAKGEEPAYQEMVKVLGGNMRAFLN